MVYSFPDCDSVLVPATLGNIVGGGLFVGGLYWYLNRK